MPPTKNVKVSATASGLAISTFLLGACQIMGLRKSHPTFANEFSSSLDCQQNWQCDHRLLVILGKIVAFR